MSKPVLIGALSILAALAFVIILAYSSMHPVKYRVEVCVAYQGRTECRIASADTKEHALRSAQNNACGLMVSGVTETMQCEHLDPVSVKWLENK
ncbi:MAG TPA: hypothetical protein VEV17_16925 [Bryobacteraceae bacterium]|nr:hypothetical protein [Bryobacteraceae bacterium]